MGLMLKLPDFAADPDTAAPKEDPRPEDLPGYADGFAAGQAQADAARAAAQAALAQSLEDLAFTFAEAHQHVLVRLRPLFAALTAQLLPQLAPTAAQARIIDTLLAAAATDIRQPAVLVLHPDLAEPVSALIATMPTVPVKLKPDAGMQPHEGLIRIGTTETVLDVDAVMQQIAEIIAALFETTEETAQHG